MIRPTSVVLLTALAAAPPGPPAVAIEHVVDLAGRFVDPRPGRGGPATVLVFARTDCPISNRYAPELRRLHERFGRGVSFWLVYVDADQPVAAIESHRREFGYGVAALRDPRHELVRLSGATVTPEAAVFVAGESGPQLAYRGRIDDRYLDFGRARPAPTSRDLEKVLESLAAGRRPAPRTTPAVGCFISPVK